MQQSGPVVPKHGVDRLGIRNAAKVHWNLPAAALYEEAIRRGEGLLSRSGALVVRTGQHTGRSPKDKYIVEDAVTRDTVHWGEVNRPITTAQFDSLRERLLAYLQGRELFVQDVHAGADPAYRLPIRVVTEQAWHSLFARNMFIPPARGERERFEPRFTIVQAPRFHADPERDGINSESFILVDYTRRLVLIGGTSYAGEIKKSAFGILNFLLPEDGVLPMHFSANVGPKGDAAIFFGLSGTGKTTLSADSARTLVGDDEHGWSDRGVFNFEGGCYAKVIRLSPEAEPEIWDASHRFGTVLENVVLEDGTRMPDLDDATLTENTRASYPLSFIPNASESGMAGHPDTVVMLTADAFGVLPPVSRLTAEQAMYHFLSGYTARIAGTEKGMGSEPQATFSTCFGAPFMPRHPSEYARLLGEKIARHGAQCWLVNTGWSGGAYGTGERVAIAHTRAMIEAILSGALKDAPARRETRFGLLVPEACPDVPADILDPRKTWSDKAAYDRMAGEVAARFEKNFRQFEGHVGAKVKDAGIRAAA